MPSLRIGSGNASPALLDQHTSRNGTAKVGSDMLAEARETREQTRQEAVHGDQQARRLLAHQAAAEQNGAPTKRPGVGVNVDVFA